MWVQCVQLRDRGSSPEVEPSAPVEPLVWRDEQLEVEQVIWVCELCPARLGQLQLADVLGDAELRRALALLAGAARAAALSGALRALLVLQGEQVQHGDGWGGEEEVRTASGMCK